MDIKNMTSQELVELMQNQTHPLNKARQQFSNWMGKIDQAQNQRKPLSPIDMRRMEFEAVIAITNAIK